MQVILRADVENLGVLGEVKNVRPGYARNWLLPQGLAMPATKGNLKNFELERARLQAKMEALRSDADQRKQVLENLALTLTMHAGENGKLYGSVTTTMIAEALADQGETVDRHKIILPEGSIRTLGKHLVKIRLHADISAQITVDVVSDTVQDAQPAEQAPAEQVTEQTAE